MDGESTVRHYFIINPNAGRRREQKKLRERISEGCDKADVTYTVYETKCANDGADFMVRTAEETEKAGIHDILRFYFCGGDGSMLEAVNGFFRIPEEIRKERVQIGAVPVGTGNDFIRNFGIAKDFLNIEKQVRGSAVMVDALTYDGRYAANMFNIGFDCQVVNKVNELRGKFFMRKGIAYPIGVAHTLIKFPHTKIRVTFDDGTTYSGKYLLTFTANGAYCGGGFKSASEAKTNDGLLDVMLVKPISRLKFLSMIGQYKKGTLVGTKKAEKLLIYKKCMSVSIEYLDEGEMNVCIDGEVESFKKVTFGIIQEAFPFSVPGKD